ncbi:Protein farnesyltransferase subunit beta like protein [Verticillium longisporum]|uniref:Protein farnesyltransferase subunit beta like protein n=1 Tax=Verticillium longisporum TaxID=100787 RepID=A0A8I2ZDG0_VERLO|nr:Protein farnesyltransferase subunit beta like protein [Verticillium longisporum]
MAAASTPADTGRPAESEAKVVNETDDGFVDISASEPDEQDLLASQMDRQSFSPVPAIFTSPPPIKETHRSHTLTQQNATMHECLPLLAGDSDTLELNRHGVPRLRREAHVKYLHKQLGKLPAPYLIADASRPWFLFWSLNGLALLGEDVSMYRQQLIDTARAIQNPNGGFGGGHGQMSHLATSFALILSIAIVGGEELYETTLFTGLADFVRRCQTFEGGLGGKPDTEAHGAYTFCALGCLAILDAPHRIIPKHLNVPRLISWLSSRQYAPEGGFSGRTNKLVDGCYSHWVGGCWPLVDAALNGASELDENVGDDEGELPANSQRPGDPHEEEWFSREGLIRYILCCAQDQSKRGGLRDKPSRPSDAYHSCYVLSGLTSAQHDWDMTYVGEDDTILAEPRWRVRPRTGADQVFDEEDRVATIHPAYTIPEQKAYAMKAYFAAKTGF